METLLAFFQKRQFVLIKFGPDPDDGQIHDVDQMIANIHVPTLIDRKVLNNSFERASRA